MTGLEALERIKNAPTIYCGFGSDIYTRFPFECKEIESDLKTLEPLRKENERLNNKLIRMKILLNSEYGVTTTKGFEVLKAFKIIKNKKVNIEYIKCCETYNQYKTICSYWNEITEEEFILLKVVL